MNLQKKVKSNAKQPSCQKSVVSKMVVVKIQGGGQEMADMVD